MPSFSDVQRETRGIKPCEGKHRYLVYRSTYDEESKEAYDALICVVCGNLSGYWTDEDSPVDEGDVIGYTDDYNDDDKAHAKAAVRY